MSCVKTGFVAFVTKLSPKILTCCVIDFYLCLFGGSGRKRLYITSRMENQITHFCGGYYRSFSKFKQQVNKMDDNMTFLQDCACFLQESSCKTDDEKKKCFTHLFFETYGKQLAGPCGCSNLIFDHELIKVNHQEFFIDLMHVVLVSGVIDCHSDHLARNLSAAFDIDFSLSTFQRKLREDTLMADKLHKSINLCKDW